MNTRLVLHRSVARGPGTAFAWCLGLASLMLAFCAVTATLLFSGERSARLGDRVPAGQFSADMRSLVEAMRYLVEPDSDDGPPGAPATENLRGFAFEATGQPSAAFSYSSNQTELPGLFTNRPARS